MLTTAHRPVTVLSQSCGHCSHRDCMLVVDIIVLAALKPSVYKQFKEQ